MINNKLGQPLQKQSNTESIEKYFFSYILENPKFFDRVDYSAFKNAKIRLIYDKIKKYYKKLDEPSVPSPSKIVELVRLHDPDQDEITNDYLEELLNVDHGDLINSSDDDFLIKSMYSWMTASNMRSAFDDAVEKIRDMDYIDYESTEQLAEYLRETITASTVMNFDDDDLGLDFFDAEAHVQDIEKNKITTGWEVLDEQLSGGWSRKTLNILMGGSNTGKSLWLANMSVNAANAGYNVLYVSLEMADTKVMKRLGAMRLRIPIDDYDKKSKDISYMEKKIAEYKKKGFSATANQLFHQSVGKLYVKEFQSGTCTVADIDNLIKNYEIKKGIKLDMVIVDYLTIMATDKRSKDNLFMNGKYLSNGLRALAQKYELVMLTAMQVAKDVQGANDISMSDMSESKSIFENADTIFGIIRSDNMRLANKYILKLVKYRDGGFKWERTHFDLNTEYLTIENAKKMEVS